MLCRVFYKLKHYICKCTSCLDNKNLCFPPYGDCRHKHWTNRSKRTWQHPIVKHFSSLNQFCHDDVIKWKHFPRYWPSVRGIHRSTVNSPHKGQWRGTLMFSLICARINCWVNNRGVGDLRRHRTHYDVIVMYCSICIHEIVDFVPRGSSYVNTLISRFMGQTRGPTGADRTQVGPMLAPWTLLSGYVPCFKT